MYDLDFAQGAYWFDSWVIIAKEVYRYKILNQVRQR